MLYTKIRNLSNAVRQYGLWTVMRSVTLRKKEQFLEWRLGISADGVVQLKDVGIDNPYFIEYGPSTFGSFRKLMRLLSLRAGADVFLDYGSGKGRVVVMAATYPFARVLGVELSPELNAVAASNVERARPRLRCKDIDLFVIDATEFVVPDDVTVVYFNNPFYGPPLASVLGQIRASVIRSPRHLSILANNPSRGSPFVQQLAHQAWLTLKHEIVLEQGRYGTLYTAN